MRILMEHWIRLSMIIVLAAGSLAAAEDLGKKVTAQNPRLPFKLEVVEVHNSQMPGFHSSSVGRSGSKCLILGGRVVGLHGFASSNNFPRTTANTQAIVIDPASNSTLGAIDIVQNLPASLAGPLTATNQESTQVGNDLYVIGGYGKDLLTQQMTTFGSIIRVDVAGLCSAIVAKQTDIQSFFTQIPDTDNRLKVTGGGLKHHQGKFYLVYGQNFTGEYSVQNSDYNRAGGQFQKYTQRIAEFTLNVDLTIGAFSEIQPSIFDPQLPFNRRDLNVVDVIAADGVSPAVTIYGGVFKAGQIAGHTAPIDLQYGSPPAVTVQSGFTQGLNHYDCAHVTIFNDADRSSYTTLFGGISQFHYDPQSRTLIRDAFNLPVDGLPFIDTISTIQRLPNSGQFAQFIQPQSMPGLLGAQAEFIHSSVLESNGALFPNSVIKLSAIKDRTLVGHIVGGIESKGPYSGLVKENPSTIATTRLFEVWITPSPTDVFPMPEIPQNVTPFPPAK